MKCFIVTFRDGAKKGYKSLSAVYEENSKEDLGVSKFTLDRYDFSLASFENEKCCIEMLNFRSRGDIIKEREQFM